MLHRLVLPAAARTAIAQERPSGRAAERPSERITQSLLKKTRIDHNSENASHQRAG